MCNAHTRRKDKHERDESIKIQKQGQIDCSCWRDLSVTQKRSLGCHCGEPATTQLYITGFRSGYGTDSHPGQQIVHQAPAIAKKASHQCPKGRAIVRHIRGENALSLHSCNSDAENASPNKTPQKQHKRRVHARPQVVNNAEGQATVQDKTPHASSASSEAWSTSSAFSTWSNSGYVCGHGLTSGCSWDFSSPS